MAKPTTMNGSHLLIMLGDGASPETFAAPCGLTAKGINFSAATNDFNVPDCDDPDAPSWTERVVSALSAGITGSGVLAMESKDEWQDWFLSGASKNIQVSLDESLANGGGYFSLAAVLTTFNITGNQGEKATLEVEIASDGEVTWTAASS
jgi:predicted secreted protein